MICQMCFEEEVIELDTICIHCKNANIDNDDESIEELLEKNERKINQRLE